MLDAGLVAMGRRDDDIAGDLAYGDEDARRRLDTELVQQSQEFLP